MLSHLAVLVLPVLALVGTGALARDLIDQRRNELGRHTHLLALLVERAGITEGADLQPLLADTFDRTRIGVRVVNTRGVVIATTGPRLGEDLSDRPEVQAALRGEEGVAMREDVPSAASHPRARRERILRWLYRAVPVRDRDGAIAGAVLSMRPVREVGDAFEDMWGDLGWGLGASVVTTLALAVAAAYVFSRSLRALARTSEALADGVPRPPHVRASRITEVQSVAGDLHRMAERLRARLHDTRDFAGHVAHEFKTPLTTLRGTVELLLTDAEMPAEQRERFLANARIDLDRLARMVDGLLALARAEESARREEVDLDGLLDLVAARFPGVARAGRAGMVSGDPTQLEVAAVNLLENARRHGGPNVVVTGWRTDGRAGFTVEDDGPGIRPAVLPQIFERFFTTGAERTGTGLGLPIVRAVCEAHGGSVEVQSVPGRTTFRVSLPG